MVRDEHTLEMSRHGCWKVMIGSAVHGCAILNSYFTNLVSKHIHPKPNNHKLFLSLTNERDFLRKFSQHKPKKVTSLGYPTREIPRRDKLLLPYNSSAPAQRAEPGQVR